MTGWETFDASGLTVASVLLTLVVLLATGRLLSRKAADRELQSLVAGHEAKDQAHAEVLALRDEQIALLKASNVRKDEIIDRQSAQLQVLLDEIAPSLQMWADATERVMGGDDATKG